MSVVLGLFERSPIVDFRSIQRVIGKKNGAYGKLIVHNLINKSIIKKVAKGKYTKHNETTLAVFCFSPSYLGLQSALSMHNLWEQETIPIVITSKKVRLGLRTVMGANVLVKSVNPSYLFGFEYIQEGQFYIPYSDIEKTLIDLVYFRQSISPAVLKSFRERIDEKKLKGYVRRYPERIRKKVLHLYQGLS